MKQEISRKGLIFFIRKNSIKTLFENCLLIDFGLKSFKKKWNKKMVAGNDTEKLEKGNILSPK